MKIEFIKRGAATRLILIFAGWSTDVRYYNDCVFHGWDTAVVSDYRELSMPLIPDQYSTVYVFAYSLGVFAASVSGVDAAVRIAICGSPKPVSDKYGIPESVYDGTIDGLNEKSLMKFHLRMAGDKSTFESIKGKLPKHPDISTLKEELSSIRLHSRENAELYRMRNEAIRRDARLVRPRAAGVGKFDRIYIAENDRIFPKENLLRFWKENTETEIVNLKSHHAVDIAQTIQSCIPDAKAIGEGFARAGMTYNDNALVQKEICNKICEKLYLLLPKLPSSRVSLLEIGAGCGLLTERWSKLLNPDMASYIDLTDTPEFGAAKEELYIVGDAEKWLEKSDESFDIILSASTIQWFADPVRFISTVKAHLNPGGFAVVSTFVKGNLHQLDAFRPAPIIYHSPEEYLSSKHVEGECWESALCFNSSREMLTHLRDTGVTQKRDKNSRVNGKESPQSSLRLTELPTKLTHRPMILIVKN